jgi:hypothetical protein
MFNPYGAFPGNQANALVNGGGNGNDQQYNAGSVRYGGGGNAGFSGLANGAGGGGGNRDPAAAWGGSSQMLGGGVTGIGGAGPFSMGPGVGGGMDDDVIPSVVSFFLSPRRSRNYADPSRPSCRLSTAIVIKNINFNLQKEDLLRTIVSSSPSIHLLSRPATDYASFNSSGISRRPSSLRLQLPHGPRRLPRSRFRQLPIASRGRRCCCRSQRVCPLINLPSSPFLAFVHSLTTSPCCRL